MARIQISSSTVADLGSKISAQRYRRGAWASSVRSTNVIWLGTNPFTAVRRAREHLTSLMNN